MKYAIKSNCFSLNVKAASVSIYVFVLIVFIDDETSILYFLFFLKEASLYQLHEHKVNYIIYIYNIYRNMISDSRGF